MTYTPKPGDTVKATLGDSVLYGTVDAQSSLPGDLYLFPIGSTVRVYLGSQWSYEPWTPPVTFKPLTVVRLAVDAPEAMFTDDHYDDDDRAEMSKPKIASRDTGAGWYDLTEGWEFRDEDIQRALAAGKAEVLFEGVDE